MPEMPGEKMSDLPPLAPTSRRESGAGSEGSDRELYGGKGMSLDRVTITGADDMTGIDEMLRISAGFPFVEWGILASPTRQGTSRYPSREWCSSLRGCQRSNGKLNLSMHICGGWARKIFNGTIDWSDLPDLEFSCKRIQINGSTGVNAEGMCYPAGRYHPKKQVIVQYPAARYYMKLARSYGMDCVPLVDESGGTGAVGMDKWEPFEAVDYVGYAGGIGPENVVEALAGIKRKGRFWIDMESRVRDENDVLDFDKVNRVLEACAREMELSR